MDCFNKLREIIDFQKAKFHFALIIFAVAFLLSSSSEAQALKKRWQQQLGSSSYDHISDLISDQAGNLYVTGYVYESLSGQSSLGLADGFIAKYNSDGAQLWLKVFGGAGDDRPNCLGLDATQEQIYLGGSFTDTLIIDGVDTLRASDRNDIFLLAIDSSGQWLWGRSYGGQGDEAVNHLIVNSQKELYLTGYFEQNLDLQNNSLQSTGLRNAFVSKMDSLGTDLWIHQMGGAQNDDGLALCFDEQEQIYLSGSFRDSAYFGPFAAVSVYTYDIFLASLNPSGQWRWLKTFGGGYIDNAPALAYQPQQHQLIIGGWFFNDIQLDSIQLLASGEEESFMAAIDTNGQVQWAQRFGEDFAELIYEIAIDEQDNIFAIGSFDSVMYLGTDTLLAKHFNRPTDVFVLGFSPQGNYQWGFRTGDLNNEFGFDICLGAENQLYTGAIFQEATVFGQDSLFAVGNYDIICSAFRIDSVVINNLTDQPQNQTAIDFHLFPNPTNSGIYWQLHGIVQLPIQLELFHQSGQLFQSTTAYHSSGYWALNPPTPGHYWLRCSAKGYPPIIKPLTIY